MGIRRTVWLIDDDQLSNSIAEGIIKYNGFSESIRTFFTAQEALSALEVAISDGNSFPDFIFLDLNMPIVNGWGFLETYRSFPKEVKGSCYLYILTSSIDEQDIKRSKLNEEVRDFISKPLSKRDLEIIKFQTSQL